MKRSRKIALALLGGATAGGFSGCSPSTIEQPARISAQSVYVNDYHVAGVGYYHAPFHRFFSYPYNYYDAIRGMYYFGGFWASLPHRSPVNISSPTESAAVEAEASRTDIVRGGFGRTGGGFSTWG